jgi:hypothetical protein
MPYSNWYCVYVFVESLNEWVDDCCGDLHECIAHIAGEIELRLSIYMAN